MATHIDAVGASVERESRALDLMGHSGARNFADLQGKAGDYRKALAGLPSGVATKVLTPGLVETETDFAHLERQYQLTPKQVTTLFKLEGIAQAQREFDALQNHMRGQHNLTVGQQIDLGSNRGSGAINVAGDLHMHGDQRAHQEHTRRLRQRAASDGVRRG